MNLLSGQRLHTDTKVETPIYRWGMMLIESPYLINFPDKVVLASY